MWAQAVKGLSVESARGALWNGKMGLREETVGSRAAYSAPVWAALHPWLYYKYVDYDKPAVPSKGGI